MNSPLYGRILIVNLLWLGVGVSLRGQPILAPDPRFAPIIQVPAGRINALAMQPDGKLLVAGLFWGSGGTPLRSLVRVNRDGTLDTSFERDAAVAMAYAVQVAKDGRILVADVYEGLTSLKRLMPNGELDSSFPRVDGVGEFAVLEDGSVLIASGKLLRIRADGSIDLATEYDEEVWSLTKSEDGRVLGVGPEALVVFNADGGISDVRTVKITMNADHPTARAAPCADGSTLIWGCFTAVNGVARTNIARLKPTGELDSQFKVTGGLSGSSRYGPAVINTAIPLEDGRVLIGGHFTAGDGLAKYGLALLRHDGSVDESFPVSLSGGTHWPGVNAIVRDTDGNSVIGGDFFGVNGLNRSCLARIRSDNSLDVGFPSFLSFTTGSIRAVAQQTDGKILVGGSFGSVNGAPRSSLARFNADGTLDSGFVPDTAVSAYVGAIAVQPDGKMIVGGYPLLLVRLNSDGTLDPSFRAKVENVHGASIQEDGKVLIYGGWGEVNDTVRPRIARLNPDGSLDLSFNPSLPVDSIQRWALRPDGKILLVGWGENQTMQVFQLLPSGDFDSTFRCALDGNWVSDACVQSDGRALIAGRFNENGRAFVVRLNTNGSIDTSFNYAASPANVHCWRVAVAQSGHTVVAEELVDGRSLAILTPDGRLLHRWVCNGWISELLPLRTGGTLAAGDLRTLSGEGLGITLANLSGLALLQPTPQMTVPSYREGRFELRVLGDAAWDYQVDVSEDLRNWVPLKTIHSEGPSTLVTDPSPPGPSRFYRVSVPR